MSARNQKEWVTSNVGYKKMNESSRMNDTSTNTASTLTISVTDTKENRKAQNSR